MTTTARAELQTPITLYPPEGPGLEVAGIDIALIHDDGSLRECRLTFELDASQYREVATRGLFHLAPDNRGPGAGTFEPGATVRIEARLDASLLSEIELLGSTPEAVAEKLRDSSLRGRWSPLVETESWFALHVTSPVPQEIDASGELRSGYSTIFAVGPPESAASSAASLPAALHLPMRAVALDVLQERDIDWEETTDPEVMRAAVASANGEWSLYVVCREEYGRCSIYSQAPWRTPETVRIAMAELLARINYGIAIGNFEMDFSDGEIRFKTSLDVAGGRLSRAMFEALLDANLAAMDAYLPALEAVRDSRMTPAEAVAAVES